MSTRAAQYTAARLKTLAQRQVKAVGKRKRPVRPSEIERRYALGEESWRVQAGLVTPEQYERYLRAMQGRR